MSQLGTVLMRLHAFPLLPQRGSFSGSAFPSFLPPVSILGISHADGKCLFSLTYNMVFRGCSSSWNDLALLQAHILTPGWFDDLSSRI